MLKKTALIVMLLGSCLAPLAWAQDDSSSEDDEMQLSEKSASAGEASGDEAGTAEFDESVADEPAVFTSERLSSARQRSTVHQ